MTTKIKVAFTEKKVLYSVYSIKFYFFKRKYFISLKKSITTKQKV